MASSKLLYIYRRRNGSKTNGIPKTIRTDKATAFTGHLLGDFCKKHYFTLIHTPGRAGGHNIERKSVNKYQSRRTLQQSLGLIARCNEKNISLTFEKSAFELHYGRKSNTEISNLLKLDSLKKLTDHSVLAKPDTLQVYSFNGAGGVSDQLPMKPKKNTK